MTNGHIKGAFTFNDDEQRLGPSYKCHITCAYTSCYQLRPITNEFDLINCHLNWWVVSVTDVLWAHLENVGDGSFSQKVVYLCYYVWLTVNKPSQNIQNTPALKFSYQLSLKMLGKFIIDKTNKVFSHYYVDFTPNLYKNYYHVISIVAILCARHQPLLGHI